MECDFDNQDMTCEMCGTKANTRDTHCNCRGYKIEKIPPLQVRLKNFSVSAIEHAKAGFPTCSDEQIVERLEICRRCDKFLADYDNPEIGACSECGCPLNELLPKFVSKLAWADQGCPLNKWPTLILVRNPERL